MSFFSIIMFRLLKYLKIISLPNLRIIDYGYGFTGSTHDSTAWEKTRIYVEHDAIFQEGEFIWGDSAYPVRKMTSILFFLPFPCLFFFFKDRSLGFYTI